MIRKQYYGVFSILALLWLCGCTVIHIDGASGATLLKSGVLKIEAADPETAIAVNVSGFGIVPETRGATLGYSNAQIVFAPPESTCKIFIFELPENQAANEMWKKLITDNSSICTTRGSQ